MTNNAASIVPIGKRFRGVLLAAIYSLGVLGIVASGGGGGSSSGDGDDNGGTATSSKCEIGISKLGECEI